MSFKEIHLKKAYSSDTDEILTDFLIPVLKGSVEYNRLTGFFSSTSLAVAARGILGLIKNDGIMKLIVSPKLTKRDLEAIVNSNDSYENFMQKHMLEELEKIADDFVKDHVSALGWMIANNKLEIKVAISYDHENKPLSDRNIEQEGIFHQKVGIFRDKDENIISFSGSVNETAMGWLGNIEEFKVFRSWELTEEDYLKTDTSKFDRYWKNESRRLRVIPVPDAVKEKLIKISPKNIEDIDLEKWHSRLKEKKEKKIELFDHQMAAIEAWLKNGQKGIFEMATGTGKTYAALGCLKRICGMTKGVLSIITCPYQHLGQQWKREIEKFNIVYDLLIIADSTNPSWKNALTDALMDMSLGYKNRIIVLTTHTTFSSEQFKLIIKSHKEHSMLMLIADEVHGLGAEVAKTGLIDEYDSRLGLSATSKRWYDSIGTNAIYDYFGGVVYEFSLEEAINSINPATGTTYLTPFRYIPRFTFLSEEELEKYNEITKSISLKYNQAKDDYDKTKYLELLMFKRADIIKDAENKFNVLESILSEIRESIDGTLIYCSPVQIEHIMAILSSKKISSHRFTMNENTRPEDKYRGLSERDFILKMFGENKYKVLVAMKCLDEGIDVPAAKTTILMSNSGNPREYIQRIGRVIRRYPEKQEAHIYDIIIVPSLKKISDELESLEWKILDKELERYEEISKSSINTAEALAEIQKIKSSLGG